MIDIEKNTKTAGAYVLYDGYFLFMFGFGSKHRSNELGVVRFGGHREKGETVLQCVVREVKEESSLDITFYNNTCMYVKKDNGGCEKVEGNQETNPILVLEGQDSSLSATYLTYGKGILAPDMETQGILLLRKEDISMICAGDTTFGAYQESGGKFLLANPLPGDCVLVPHVQLRFLNDLFTLESELMAAYMHG